MSAVGSERRSGEVRVQAGVSGCECAVAPSGPHEGRREGGRYIGGGREGRGPGERREGAQERGGRGKISVVM